MNKDSLSQLRSNWLFSSKDDAELAAVGRFSSVRQLEPNQTLFWQGDSVGHVFLVLDGALKLTRHDRKNRWKIARIAGAPDLVALHCLFAENGYTTTAVATQYSSVLAINAERLVWHIKERPQLAWRVALYLSREVECLVGEVEQLAMSSASERLAAYLLRLHDEPEQANGERVPRRRADLASLLSLSTETLCREISKFRRRGWIATDNGGFSVLEPDRLRSLVESRAEN